MILTKDSGQTHLKSLVRLEIVVWAIYFLTVIYYALMSSLPITTLLIILIALAFFDFWRNYFSGIILKFGDKLHLGDSITVNGHSGKIIEFGDRALKIVSSIGEELLIPYRLINMEVKIGQKSAPKILLKTLTIEDAIKDPILGRKEIEKVIYSNPWIIISSPINIAIEDQQANLNFYVLNNDFFEKAKQRLLKDLS